MPIADLKDLKSHFDTIVYVSYLTVQPEQILVNDYVERMITELSDKNWFGF
jgi:MerR family transcriptional regulator, light-induced transcriptional regulator